MPGYVTNGRAATLTAEALELAIDNTELWYQQNPNATQFSLGEYWKNQINLQMNRIGGAFSTIAPFTISYPAPYITSFWGNGNCG